MFVEVIMAVGENKSAKAVWSFIGINFYGEVTGEYSGCYAAHF